MYMYTNYCCVCVPFAPGKCDHLYACHHNTNSMVVTMMLYATHEAMRALWWNTPSYYSALTLPAVMAQRDAVRSSSTILISSRNTSAVRFRNSACEFSACEFLQHASVFACVRASTGVCVCVCVCMHMCLCLCLCVLCLCLCVHVNVYVCMCMLMCACVCVCVCTRVPVYVCMCVCLWV
jgi:hypothetical protein